MKYFKHFKTLEEVKREYLRLVKIHHPDRGGVTAAFQDIQNQFESWIPTTQDDVYRHKHSGKLADLINSIVNVTSAEITIVGAWLWVEVAKAHKDQLKEAITDDYRIRWNRKRSLWQISPVDMKYRKTSKKEFSKEELVNFYGGGSVDNNQNKIN